MPPYNRHRRKQTVYLGNDDNVAIQTIRETFHIHTKASAIRFAVRRTARLATQTPDKTVVFELIDCVESLTMLTKRDARQLTRLCRKVRGELNP